jgi:hypothetical protein
MEIIDRQTAKARGEYRQAAGIITVAHSRALPQGSAGYLANTVFRNEMGELM